MGESGYFIFIFNCCMSKSVFCGMSIKSSSSATGVPWLKLGVSLVADLTSFCYYFYISFTWFLNPGIITVAGAPGPFF